MPATGRSTLSHKHGYTYPDNTNNCYVYTYIHTYIYIYWFTYIHTFITITLIQHHYNHTYPTFSSVCIHPWTSTYSLGCSRTSCMTRFLRLQLRFLCLSFSSHISALSCFKPRELYDTQSRIMPQIIVGIPVSFKVYSLIQGYYRSRWETAGLVCKESSGGY